MQGLKEGDIVFSLVNRKIVSLNTVAEDCISARIPKEAYGIRMDGLLEQTIDQSVTL